MANFMTVSLECRTEEVRQIVMAMLAGHREFVVKQSQAAGIADLVVLELDEYYPERTFADIRSILSTAPRAEIALTTARTEPQVMLEAFRLGVKEFLPQPLSHSDVEQALARSKSRFLARGQSTEVNVGAICCIIGGKSGIGTSTVALNLAVALKKVAPHQSVALVDLNLQSNDLALFLDVAAPRGLQDLADDLSRLDPAIVQSVLAKHDSGIQLLAAGASHTSLDFLTPGCMLHTLDLLRSLFDYVVVDCGHLFIPPVKEAIESASRVFVVATLNVPTISRTKFLVQLLQQKTESERPISLVINRYATKQEELLKQAEEALRLKVAWLLPNDYATASQALDGGTPLVQLAPRTDVTKEYLKRATEVMKEFSQRADSTDRERDQVQEKKGSFLTRLWPGFSPNGKAKSELV